ncbi:MAG: PAS domain-containing protein [Gammaproteobacteria bacterium]|nr:PAS domain-containing protein [Gammaproteobacteria bacterium]
MPVRSVTAYRAPALDAEQIDSLLQGSDFGFWQIDVARDEVYWYGDWCAAMGVDPCLGPDHRRRWAARIHPDDGSPFARYNDLIEGQYDFYETEYRLRTLAGGWRWVMVRARVVRRDEHGRALRVAGVTIDIDARKRAELELRAAEARLATATWGTRIGVWENSLEGQFRWLNDWCTALGIDPCEGPSNSPSWRANIHPDDLDLCLSAWSAEAAGLAGTYIVEYRVRTRSGRWRWIHERAMVTAHDEAGRAIAFVGVCIDIDERKRMELELQSQARILETMREGVALVDAADRIEFTNPAFERMAGRDRGALLGTHVLDVLAAPAGSPAQREAAVRRLLHSDDPRAERSVLLHRADGTPFAAEVLSNAIDWQGEQKRVIVIQDVSERKRLEQEIAEIVHLERQRLGSDLHDGLGQELTGIALLLRGIAPTVAAASPPAATQLDEIIALTNQAIQNTRKMALGLSPVALDRGGLVESLHRLVDRTRANYGVTVRLRGVSDAVPAIEESSATHLYLIAQEALLNACEHGRARQVTISLRANPLQAALSIVDDGVGLRPAPRPGRGMGMTIMQYRARAVGGSLRIEGRRGGGTRVRCVFPLLS